MAPEPAVHRGPFREMPGAPRSRFISQVLTMLESARYVTHPAASPSAVCHQHVAALLAVAVGKAIDFLLQFSKAEMWRALGFGHKAAILQQ